MLSVEMASSLCSSCAYESQVGSDSGSQRRNCARLEVDNRLEWVLFLKSYLLGYGIKLLLGGLHPCCTPPEAILRCASCSSGSSGVKSCTVQRPERLEAHVKRIALLVATCLIPALASLSINAHWRPGSARRRRY